MTEGIAKDIQTRRIVKRVLCPSCRSKMSIPYATDGTWIIQDGKPMLIERSDYVEEVARKVAVEEVERLRKGGVHQT